METIDSTGSGLSLSFSHIGLGRQHNQAITECSLVTAPLVAKAERHLLLTTPADTVLTRFRVVRQQDQALQSQRHTALQRLNYLQHNAAAQQQVVLGRADARVPVPVCSRSGGTVPPNLLKDAMLLADRARSQHSHVHERKASGASRKRLSRPATSAALGQSGRLSPQQWAPAPCSIACTSFRQSLPPHAPAQSCGPGVTVTRKVYTPGASHGRAETSLSKRTAYSEVLRRVRSAHGTPTPVNAQQHSSPVEPLGPWSE